MSKNEIFFPPFEDLVPSTITLVALIDTEIDVRKAFLNIQVVEKPTVIDKKNKKSKFPLVEEEGIISIRMKISEGQVDHYQQLGFEIFREAPVIWICRGMQGNCPFSNSLAVDYSAGAKNFSIKVFSNGKLQLCGCRSEEEAEILIDRNVNLMKKCQALPEEAEIAWIQPQRINYRYDLERNLNLGKLREVLLDQKIITSIDNLSTRKIGIVLTSNVSKVHLKSKKPARQQIDIYPSGKINQGGPSFDEIREFYDKLVGALITYFEDLK